MSADTPHIDLWYAFCRFPARPSKIHWRPTSKSRALLAGSSEYSKPPFTKNKEEPNGSSLFRLLRGRDGDIGQELARRRHSSLLSALAAPPPRSTGRVPRARLQIPMQ